MKWSAETVNISGSEGGSTPLSDFQQMGKGGIVPGEAQRERERERNHIRESEKRVRGFGKKTRERGGGTERTSRRERYTGTERTSTCESDSDREH